MAKIIGEYRFVFTDESSPAKQNNSLSSTAKQAERTANNLPKSNPTQSSMKTFSKATALTVGAVATGVNVYRTVRDVSINRKTTDAVISGNMQAARNIAVQKANQDRVINQATNILGYVASGAAIGAMGGPVGATVGAVVGMTAGIGLSIYRDINQHKESVRLFQSEIAEQKYTGEITSRRLVNATGRVR